MISHPDIYLIDITAKYNISMYSANGVPYPLDEYLQLTGKPTAEDIAKVVIRWPKMKRNKRNEHFY